MVGRDYQSPETTGQCPRSMCPCASEATQNNRPLRWIRPAPLAERETERQLTTSPPVELPKRLEGAEPSHAFRAAQDLLAEINILREELGARDVPPEVALLEDHTPFHVYAKTLEVLTKVTQTQHRLGVHAGTVGRIPFREIDAADILVNIEYTLGELGKIKAHTGIERQIDSTPLKFGKTPSMIYKSLADASFLLDALRGVSLTSSDVYRHVTSVLDDVALIAAELEVPVGFEPVAVEGARKSVDVAQQLLRATYKVVNLQTRLQMDASRVPTISLVKVTPSENYDMTNILWAELARIKLHLGIDGMRQDRPEQSTDKGTDDVFALVQLVVGNLDRLSGAVTG